MAFPKIFFLLFSVAVLSLSSVRMSQAARHLLDTPAAPPPALPVPTIPSLPKTTLPPLPSVPTLPKTTLPPLPSLPTQPKTTLPPLPSLPNQPKATLTPTPSNPLHPEMITYITAMVLLAYYTTTI
ncbi:hypothetical protein C1H46_023054 [Malus baccata]|uniref:Uncharacterized protein n=1 Tax=Malus baccata TaxID=106549 RepID=A0A540LY03_MALBA|nr:hypothetical protein C1H46_023054 [Malus baccata]